MAKGMNLQIVAGKATQVETRQVNGKVKSRISVKGFPFFVVAWETEVNPAISGVKEGDTLFVTGRVETRSYDKDGQTHYITEVIARSIVNLSENAGNVTFAIGNLGRDPEMRYTGSGKAVTNFSVAAQAFGQEGPEWFSVTTWEKLAEVCDQYLGKGDRVALTGRLNLDAWQDDAGQKHFRTRLTASDLLMLGGRNNGQGNGNGDNEYHLPAQAGESAAEDDIPF